MMKNFVRASVVVAIVLAGLSIRPSAQTPIETTLAVSGAANQTPWVASQGSLVAVVWGASTSGKGDIISAVSRDSGRTFAAPVRVNAVAGEARISGEIAPRVAIVPTVGSTAPE